MNENRAHRAFARGLFVFIGPASVVGKRFPLKEIHIVGGRLVDQHQQNFAAHVDAFVVVPFIFGSFDPIADIYNVRIHVGLGLLGLVVGNVVVQRSKIPGVIRGPTRRT